MAAHDYWRVSFLDSQGGGYPACADIQFRPSTGAPVVPSGGAPSHSGSVFGQPAINVFDGDPATGVVLGGGSGWMAYHYAAGAGPDVQQLSIQADKNYYGNEGPKNVTLDWSDDGVTWTVQSTLNCGGAWASDEIRVFDVTPPPPPGMKASEGRVFVIASTAAVQMRLTAGRVFAIYNFPSATMRASAAKIIAPVKRDSPIEVSQVRTIAIVKGRVANPRVRAWTFTLDGHDFYVLRLGDRETLVYDTTSKQWVDWNSDGSGAWRPNIGTTWVGAQRLAQIYGSNIVAGDDTFGLLWFLDPRQAFDDAPDKARARQQIPFVRVVTGQVLATGRQQIPCYAVFLDGDNYGLSGTEFSPTVLLETSDDQGRTFDAHDTYTVTAGTQDRPDTWYSLGQFGSPGRMFRITDTGVYARIDSLEMNDDAG